VYSPKQHTGSRHRGLRIVLILLVMLSILTAAAFWRGLVTRRYRIASDDLTSSFRIVAVSDLHGAEYGKRQADILSLITRQDPDIILLAGDIIDDVFPLENSLAFAKGAAGIAPCFYITGSHDLWYPGYRAARQELLDMGIKVLEGETVPVTVNGQTVIVCGIDDPTMGTSGEVREAYRAALSTAFSTLPEDTFNILLAHRPDYISDYVKYAFDLVISGHTHGGQIRIPFILNGLYVPDQGWYPRYAGGLYWVSGVPLIISRGVSYYPDLPRIFNPPEIVVIELQGK
jgi:uncharacterized protein